MVAPDRDVKGGIASVVNGYREYDFGGRCEISYVESYCDGSKWKKLLKAVRGYGIFWRELRKNRPDIVHVHSSFGPSFYRKIPFIYMARAAKIPVVNHIHGAEFEPFYTNASSGKKKLVKRVYHKCSALIALSEEWRRNLELITEPEKITVIENYCRIPELSEGGRKDQILFLGEIGRRKGCFDLPEIYRRAAEKSEKLPLVMAGSGAVEEVRRLFAERGLSEEVSFPGWVRGEEKERLLRESSIFLFPSYYEGMSMAVLEAMAYGLAIVTTNAGGIPQLIEDGASGCLGEPGNVEQLSEALSELIREKEKREQFGSRARQRAMDYSIDSHVDRLLGLYERVLGG